MGWIFRASVTYLGISDMKTFYARPNENDRRKCRSYQTVFDDAQQVFPNFTVMKLNNFIESLDELDKVILRINEQFWDAKIT